MEEPDRPDPDADASEIQEWMDESFDRSVVEGMESVDDGNVTVEIIDYERDEVVGTIDTDGNLDTESEALRNVSGEYIDRGIPVLVPMTNENDEGETVHADAEVIIEPGADGFVRAFVDELPSPFDCDMGVLDELPTFDMREPSSEGAMNGRNS
ncbi:hypothetical protein [Natronorubrum bangense]|uniref:Uncharacterized protein n=2 Tax=Natronorubrum bangense TaxID=61858 RepID=L9WS06_9EURY|nr:hypothetical protein [Natronorubrum bangense]ELY51073.1 hypothetical protein C494_04341 [Natronorubrum bangense JCM 10635]QCC54509.1 hypothetical protein DV706_08490 [Natronorubrum bangense]